MSNCEPPAGTSEGTLCVLRRPTEQKEDQFILGSWLRGWWQIRPVNPAFNKLGVDAYLPAQLEQLGWRYAGICPDLPNERPLTAQEIARQALEWPQSGPDGYHLQALRRALRRIAEMRP